MTNTIRPYTGNSDNSVSVGESVYRQIKSDIVFGRLQPNGKLKLQELRDHYGVSVTTLREVLNRLNSEGLVVAEGQRGFQVASTSVSNLQSIADLRILIEGYALRRSFTAGDLDWESRVVAAHHKLTLLEKQLIGGDESARTDWRLYDFEFHIALVSACGSRELLELHASYYEKYLRYQLIFSTYTRPMISVVDRAKVATGHHQLLFDAALRRDADAAVEVLREHIENSVAETIKAVTLHAEASASTKEPRSARTRPREDA
ncbi:GntR family transcriptional regulator [Hydrogenophaga sp.]|uniref:GntR family transcriptional regulator n=1 Tax=Hydrogenophaga sp. TaxID=1904254 RepID=UPI00272804DF|nr:GntR family transcriptional regulator [Hydrogenophaga sp.]MDO9436263.1 GntR family transcriptional regulator [Hydrogenophaga sp.]